MDYTHTCLKKNEKMDKKRKEKARKHKQTNKTQKRIATVSFLRTFITFHTQSN